MVAASSAPNVSMVVSSMAHSTPSASGAAAHPQVDLASPPEAMMEDYLNADHDDNAPLYFCSVDNVLRKAPTPKLTHGDLEERLLLASDAEPASFDEAMHHECWRHAMSTR